VPLPISVCSGIGIVGVITEMGATGGLSQHGCLDSSTLVDPFEKYTQLPAQKLAASERVGGRAVTD
jgi:hypothetical protein